MKIVKQKVFEFPVKSFKDDELNLLRIEYAARTCYATRDKTGKSTTDFIARLLNKKHLSPLEHGYATFRFHSSLNTVNKFLQTIKYPYIEVDEKFISGNYRAFYDYLMNEPYNDRDAKHALILVLHKFLPSFFNQDIFPVYSDILMLIDKVEFKIEHIETVSNEYQKLPKKHQFKSLAFTTNRRVADQLRTHRRMSFLMESTRYVKYDNIEVVLPEEVLENKDYLDVLEGHLLKMEHWVNNVSNENKNLLLPLCVKTEMVCSGRIPDWEYMLDLRTGKGVYSLTKQLAEYMKEFVR